MFKSILVPTDGSKLSQKAVKKAIELANIAHAKLVALHVLPKFSDSRAGIFRQNDMVADATYDRQVRAEAERLFAGIKKQSDAAGVKLEAVLVESNHVWKAIISAAKKKCDVICMASHGRHGLSGVVLGSQKGANSQQHPGTRAPLKRLSARRAGIHNRPPSVMSFRRPCTSPGTDKIELIIQALDDEKVARHEKSSFIFPR